MYDIATTTEAYAAFDDYLDETNEPATVAGQEFLPSRVLWEVDPIAYRCEFNDWAHFEGIDTDNLDGDLYRH